MTASPSDVQAIARIQAARARLRRAEKHLAEAQAEVEYARTDLRGCLSDCNTERARERAA